MNATAPPLEALKAAFPDALWPLVPWLAGKLLMIPPSAYSSINCDRGLRETYHKWVWSEFLRDPSERTPIRPAAFFALSPSWCRRWRRNVKKALSIKIREMLRDPDVRTFLMELNRQRLLLEVTMLLRRRLANQQEQRCTNYEDANAGVQAWSDRIDQAYRYPKRAANILPPTALVGRTEAGELLDKLGPKATAGSSRA